MVQDFTWVLELTFDFCWKKRKGKKKEVNIGERYGF